MQCAADLGSERALTDGPGELPHHADGDVRIQQGTPDLADRGIDVGLGQPPLAAQGLEGGGQSIGKGGEHASSLRPRICRYGFPPMAIRPLARCDPQP